MFIMYAIIILHVDNKYTAKCRDLCLNVFFFMGDKGVSKNQRIKQRPPVLQETCET